jgi:hypothetical protein
MIETISPAVCGTRRRTVFALTVFAAGAFAAAIAVGLLLSSLRGFVPDVILAPLALAGAVAVLRTRRQVPEQWHYRLPLPVWAAGYGAGLGAGVVTYQPSVAFVCVALAVIALHAPWLGVVAFAAFAIGRVATAALPASSVDALPRLYAPMRRLALVTVAVLLVSLVAAPAHAAAVSNIDPSAEPDGTLAFTERAADGSTTVVVQPGDGSAQKTFPGGSWPALDGTRLAYVDKTGIAIVTWATGDPVAHLDGHYIKPALAWPVVIAVRLDGGRKTLVTHDMTTGAEHVLDRASTANDLGRPSTDGQTVVWHLTTTHVSKLRTARLGVFRTSTFLHSHVRLYVNPSIRGGRIVYVVQRHGHSLLSEQLAGVRKARGLILVRSPFVLWTTANDGTHAYVTSWNTDTGIAVIRRVTE